MNIKDFEFILSRFADSSLFGNVEKEALKVARDIVATIRATASLPPDIDVKDIESLIRHKLELPERPQAIVRLPSCDGEQFQRLAILPEGFGLKASIEAANAAIHKANQEDHFAKDGGCMDGLSVSSSVQRAMENLGFVFPPIESTNCWDEYRPDVCRSEQNIIDQTNELARKLYLLRGYTVPEGYRFDRATHPHEVEAWQGACEAQAMLTATSPEDALANLGE